MINIIQGVIRSWYVQCESLTNQIAGLILFIYLKLSILWQLQYANSFTNSTK